MLADEMFTTANIMSVAGATLAVNVVTNTAYRLGGFSPKWVAFATALAVAYLVVAMQTAPPWYAWVLAFFNACLLFCSAAGVNELGAKAVAGTGKGVGAPAPLLKSWFHA